MFQSNSDFMKSILQIVIFSTLFCIFTNQSIKAVPLSPEIVEQLKESGQLQKFIDRMATAKSKGVCQPFAHDPSKGQETYSLDANAIDTFRVIVILADFSDNPASSGTFSATVADFEQLLFSDDSTDNNYSMTEFYYDNSYGNFVLEGVVVGWYRLPQTYAYYVDGQNGFGPYPTNAQRMAEDAINAADPFVDYSQVDNDGNGTADGVFVVHAGAGAESTSSDFQIWSHAWSTSFTMNLDGISISRYTTEPEEMSSGLITQGVFSHEYGHFLGLPDLYDTDYSSAGIGRWSLMAGGSWNFSGRFPAFLDAWCKKQLGFITLTNITSNQQNLEIPSSYHNPTAFRLWENGTVGQQYFIVENRQNTGNDKGIPGSGLLIYHIDESQWGNSDETHYLVAIEQADGKFDLENDLNSGDGGDVWSTLTKTEFSNLTIPNTNKYNGSPTNTVVWNITAPDSLMYANLDISFSAPKFNVVSSLFSDSLFGNNNGVVEVGETITFSFTANNLWLTANNVIGSMVSGNSDFTFTTSSVNIGTINGEGGTGSNIGSPIVFDIPATFDPCIDSFYLTITSDNPQGDITVGFELQVGSPEVFVIDDDNGAAWEQAVTNTLNNLRIPYDVYDKSISGSPSASLLNNYKIVIWITGNDRADVLSAADVTSMIGFMDNGGKFMLSGQSITEELSIDDLSFLQNYLKADYDSDLLFPFIDGQAGSKIGDGIKVRYDSWTNQTSPEKMTLFGVDGVSEFEIQVGGVLGISYDGSYKSLLMSFGFEGISNINESSGYSTQDTVLARIMSFFDYGDVNKFSNPFIDSILLPNEISVNSVVSSDPTFFWNYADTTGATQLQYQIQVGSGNLCFNADDMWDSGLLSGSVDSIVYSGAILQDGMTYFVRIRAYNGTDWSSWRRTTFTMNIAPLSGALVSPVNDNLVTTDLPTLVVNNGFDGNGDAMTYEVELYSDSALTNLITSATSVAEGASTTSWVVDVNLSEDSRYYWRSRPNDGLESALYSETGSFYVNQFNQAPTSFGLVAPADTIFSVGLTPTFVWNVSTDADIGDLVTYTLVYSDDSLFGIPLTANTAGDTSYTIVTPLTDKVTYYWKVSANDLANDTTWSTDMFSFNTGSSGCCIGVRGNIDGLADIDISDLVYLVAFMFQGGPSSPCPEEGNVDGLAGIDISDLVYLVAFMFQSGATPPSCP